MRFDEGIDKCIVEQLTKNHAMSFLELFREVKNSYKKISIAAYNFHIKKLVTEDLIGRQDSGERGRKVNYSLTQKAKQLHRLKILEFKSDKQRAVLERETREERQKKLYLLLFFFYSKAMPRMTHALNTEQLTHLLAMYRYSIKDLVVTNVTETRLKDGRVLIYTSYEQIGNIQVNKSELRSTDPNLQEKQKMMYPVFLPGISKGDILYNGLTGCFLQIDFTPEEVEDACITISNEGILKPFMEFNGERSYEISNKALDDLLNDTYDIWESVSMKMETLWEFIRRPTEEEMKWLEIFHGQRDASNIRTEKYKHRHSLPKKEKQHLIEKAKYDIKLDEELLKEMIEEVRKNHINTIKTYNYPIEELLEMIYPPYLHRVL
jgi:DNA-binding MarR family transcriptional regulator